MDAKKMSDDILKFYRLNMKSLSPKAIPTDFQEELCGAISKGTVATLKKAKTLGAGQENPGTSGVGLVADPQLMIKVATTAMMGFSGGGGVALSKMMESFFIPLAAHLAKNVEVKSTSGFGGQGGPPVGAVPPAFEAAIFKELKSDTQKRMAKASQGKNLIKAISLGLGAGMAAAIPGLVPSAGTTGGPLVGIFK